MTTSFPAGLDALTNPTSSNTLNSPPHSAQHANANDAVEALEAKVGIDDSAATTSLDYKVAHRLPSAVDIGTDTDPNPVTAVGDITVVTVPADTVILAVKLAGDTFPRWVLAADPNSGLSMGDGTFDAYAAGSVIRNDSTNLLHVSSGGGYVFISAIECDGDVKTAAGKGPVIQSPSSLLYRIKVADDGTLSTEQVLTWP